MSFVSSSVFKGKAGRGCVAILKVTLTNLYF